MEYTFSAIALILNCKADIFNLDLFFACVLTFIYLLVKVVTVVSVSVGTTDTDTDTKPEAEILTNTDTDTSIGCSLIKTRV